VLEGAHGVSGFQPSDGDLPALAGPCRSPARIECFIVTRRSRGGRISGQKDPGDVRHCDEGATHTESDLGTPAARRPRPDPPSSAWWPDSSTRVYQRVGRPTVAATPASRWRRKRGIPLHRILTLRTPASPERTARGHRLAGVSLASQTISYTYRAAREPGPRRPPWWRARRTRLPESRCFGPAFSAHVEIRALC
jgi:hypothetical protein